MPESNVISDVLRSRKITIGLSWEEIIAANIPELEKLGRSELIDHLPEFLDGLALWVEGDTEAARTAFEALAVGHAIQRIGFGIELRTLTREYILLREVITRELEHIPLSEALRAPMRRLTEGLDEAMMEAVRRYAEHRDRMRDRFIGVLGHDIRNPLNAIAMAGSVLSLSKLDDQHAKLASVIVSGAERIGRMVEDILDLARAHTIGGIPLKLARVNMGEIHTTIVEELQVAHPNRMLRLVTKGVLTGMFDRDRVFQAVSNLIGNAIQHGADPVDVEVCETTDRRAIETRVTSHGEPIPTAALHTLFDPLVQAQRHRNEGLGLGLYIASQIALAHGATCDVTSTREAGTTFTIHWPRANPEELPIDIREG